MKKLGKQPRRHDFFLNPYQDWRFSRCPKCDEKTRLRKFLFSERAPALVGNDYLVMGTMDRAVWRQSLKDPIPIGELLDHVHVFRQVLRFEPEHYGWVRE